MRVQAGGSCVKAAEAASTIDVSDGRKYFFDHVFGADATQERVYAAVARPLLHHFLDGYNCTVLAYGQTGSGKTYTMGTDAEGLQRDTADRIGILPRLAEDLFAALEGSAADGGGGGLGASKDGSGGAPVVADIQCQFLEIYNNEIRDLLSERAAPAGGHSSGGGAMGRRPAAAPRPAEVTLRESGQQIVVGGAVRRDVPNMTELMSVFHAGCSARTTGAQSF
jgi:Kinesin motor domain